MKEWTLMFYFAGDNDVAPVMVSELKAIKNAGFHEDVDVLIHFDPNEPGARTRIFDVNRERKRETRNKIGDNRDSFVHNMRDDVIEPKEVGTAVGRRGRFFGEELNKPDSTNAEDSLTDFLDFCLSKHRAKRYMLFLVGHGMVVGNDAFLPDEHPLSAITLKGLGEILKSFSASLKKPQETFELLALHSCSMIALEVAYELKGTAKFMIASEGPSFVGSWPYRQLLIKIFNNLEDTKRNVRRRLKGRGIDQNKAAKNPDIDITKLIEDLYHHTFFNAADFLLAGHPLDLALCSLDPGKIDGVARSLQGLVAILIESLKASSRKDDSPATRLGKRIKELVLLAHLEAQSYWGESYTDLFDFCRCLGERCGSNDDLKDLHKACSDVMKKLKLEKSERVVIRSRNFGSKSQYSHGLSIFFPWSRPIEDVSNGEPIENVRKAGRGAKIQGEEKNSVEKKGVLERYKEYAFTDEVKENTWLDFLETYFDKTQRPSREQEDGKRVLLRQEGVTVSEGFRPLGLSSMLNKVGPRLDKVGAQQGADCTCASIKNYPQISEEKKPRKGKAGKGKA